MPIATRRKPVNKKAAAREFNRDSQKTDQKNMQAPPLRGGFRL